MCFSITSKTLRTSRDVSNKRRAKLKVFFTTDVEIWCESWNHLDGGFTDAFNHYIHGTTPTGNYGLSFQARMLRNHGLTGVFFVEPLFTLRFGAEPLSEITGLISEHGQHVELHLHPEWLDESNSPVLSRQIFKRKYIRDFTLNEQKLIIEKGKSILEQSTGDCITAFRAGNFGFNRNTLAALRESGIQFDSSYNRRLNKQESGLDLSEDVQFPQRIEGVWEYPLTVFEDGFGRERQLQITACSLPEIISVLWKSLEAGLDHVTILSHNFELLDQSRTRVEPVVLRRFEGLCQFFAEHHDVFDVVGFRGLKPKKQLRQHTALQVSPWGTARRYIEQASMRVVR
jgi:hypothetical protein